MRRNFLEPVAGLSLLDYTMLSESVIGSRGSGRPRVSWEDSDGILRMHDDTVHHCIKTWPQQGE